jgi:bifunctional non-homologous end joining protein LigD
VLPGAKPAPFPAFIEPALATLRTTVPHGRSYVHEAKLDGYRVQAHLQDGRVTLYTRSGLDWTKRFPPIAADIGRLPAAKLVVDGEIVSTDATGRPSFSALQDDLKRGRHERMVYYVFDLLHLDGFDTRAAPLIERKRVLESFLAEASAPGIMYSEHFVDGADLYARACDLELEGVVSKRSGAPYRSGRTEGWVKVKCARRGRYVVVGFVPGAGGISALRLGRRDDKRSKPDCHSIGISRRNFRGYPPLALKARGAVFTVSLSSAWSQFVGSLRSRSQSVLFEQPFASMPYGSL